MKTQKGFAPIIVVITLLVIGGLSIGLLYFLGILSLRSLVVEESGDSGSFVRSYPTLSAIVTLPPNSNNTKLNPDLIALLQRVSDDTQIDVSISIWIKEVEPSEMPKRPDSTLPLEERDKQMQDQLDRTKERMKAAQQGVVQEITSKGGSITYASESSPLVFAYISKRVILELAQRYDVLSIEVERKVKDL